MRSSVRYTLAITLFFVWVTFWRIAADPFDLVKATILWIGGSAVLGLASSDLYRALKNGGWRVHFPVGFLVAAALSTAFSQAPLTSLFGQYQRYTGLLTISVCVVLFLVVSNLASGSDVRLLSGTVVAACLVANTYGLLQEFDLDPFEWSSSSFGKFVFGTLGNPNSASGFTSLASVGAVHLLITGSATRQWKVLSAVSIGFTAGMLALYDSFQGTAAALAVGIILLVIQPSKEPFSDFVAKSALGLLLIILPNISIGRAGVVVGIAVGLIAGLIMTGWKSRREVGWKPRVIGVSLGGLVMAVPVFVFFDVSAQIRSGFVERGDFYRAGLRIFGENPIVGAGLETFGFNFTRFRSASHAINLETSRTTSVHSVQLGMFSNGGLVLGLAYLLFIGWILVVLIRRAKNSAESPRNRAIFWILAVLVIQIQSSVSVEHVALYPLYFVIYACALADVTRVQSERRDRKPRRESQVARTVTALLLVSLALVLATRPLRAGVASMNAFERLVQGDGSGALREFENATALAPWEGLYWYQTSQLYMEAGNTTNASKFSKTAIEKTRYASGIGLDAVKAVVSNGELEEAREFALGFIVADPHAPSLRASLVGLFEEVGQWYLSEGFQVEGERALAIAEELGQA